MGEQKGRGVASRIYSVSPIANTVEVTVSDDGQYTVDRIVCVVDCGFAVNPLGIESQIHGGIMLGLNAAAMGAIDIEEGVLQSNFHDYVPLRFHQMPKLKSTSCHPMRLQPEWVNKPARPSGLLWLTRFLMRRPANTAIPAVTTWVYAEGLKSYVSKEQRGLVCSRLCL